MLKTAQVELANIAAELEAPMSKPCHRTRYRQDRHLRSGDHQLAPLYGQTVEQFLEMNSNHLISVEAAGAGFAASIALAGKFHGQLTSSKAALFAAGIACPAKKARRRMCSFPPKSMSAPWLPVKVRRTLQEQAEGWRARPLFERQWMLRDFRKEAGLPVEEWLEGLARLERP